MNYTLGKKYQINIFTSAIDDHTDRTEFCGILLLHFSRLTCFVC